MEELLSKVKAVLKDDYNNWYSITKNIIIDSEYQKRKYFKHHEKESIFEHSILVSACSYKLAKKHHTNIYNSTIAGLLHDFYTYPWQYSIELEKLDSKYKEHFKENTKHKKFLELHGFTHAIDAANNASIYYEKYINEKIVSAIRTHMFPLSLLTKYKIPNCKEGYIITLADKIITLKDFPTPNEIPKYLGIRKK